MPGREKMQEEVGKQLSYEGLEDALSLERFGRYLGWAGNDRNRAIELYTLNTAISEALYTPMQMLEIALRNRIHAVMTDARHERWFEDEDTLLGTYQPAQLAKAIKDIEDDDKEATAGRIVAALTFSFWTTMFNKDFDALWQKTLHDIGRREDGKGLSRKDFSGRLTPIRVLRNRIAHHEPILTWNLPKHFASIVVMTGWLSPVAAEWGRAHSRFSDVYPAERIALIEEDASEQNAVAQDAVHLVAG